MLVVVFISITALCISLFLYIYWFIETKKGLMQIVKKFHIGKEEFFAPETWSVILTLSILVALILIGIGVIYIYFQKILGLYRLQKKFIQGFTHELKTPVTSIQLYIDTFKKHDLKRKDQLKYLDYMQKDVKRLYSHIQKILSLARLESKTDATNFKTIEISSLIQKSYDSYSNIKRNIDLSIEHKNVFAYIDQDLFEILIINILNNAIKYNNSLQPAVKIFFQITKRKIKIFFSDNGTGIRKNELKKIFRQFYQLDNSSKGTGLGLHFVKIIVKRHKGKVYAESLGINKGTTIIIELKNKFKVKN